MNVSLLMNAATAGTLNNRGKKHRKNDIFKKNHVLIK